AAPAPAPAARSKAWSLEDAASAWERVFRTLQASQPRIAAAVDGGAPTAAGAGEIVVELPPGRQFQKRTLEQPETRAAVEKLLAEEAGGPVRVQYRVAEASGDFARRAPKKDVYSDPGVRKVLDAFDGGVIHVQGDKE
ncbi:MAG TPA: hypothetical protein VEI02_11485, partial [Planctomycetota bacterium]|nr:hypothetical protein [Planctomycetota bacterium]